MKILLIYFTAAGGETCRKIEQGLRLEGHHCKSSDGRRLPEGLSKWTEEAFTSGEALVFVSAAGISVRAIAPYVKTKTGDPAVIVADEKGVHVISLLSGHMGGANRLTRRIAAAIGAEPVITTATDINGRFAVDEWAKTQGLHICSMKMAKEVSAALLRKEQVGFYSEFPVNGSLPEGLVFCRPKESRGVESPPLTIVISLKNPSEEGWKKVLWLTPRILVLGIGCRKGVEKERIQAAAERALAENGLCEAAVKAVASIDIKGEEPGLLQYAAELGVPFTVYRAETLLKTELPLGFTASAFVKSVTGVDNVCERSAICKAAEMSEEGKTELLVPKRAADGVTVAVAANVADFRLRI